jgi:phosphate transport system substrate-binding protein
MIGHFRLIHFTIKPLTMRFFRAAHLCVCILASVVTNVHSPLHASGSPTSDPPAPTPATVTVPTVPTPERPKTWAIGNDKFVERQAPTIKVDPAIPEYSRAANVSGTIRSIGSSVLSNLLSRWATEFKLVYPAVELDVTGGGSESAPIALVAGSADLAPMSRAMNAREIESFKQRFGYEPTRLTVAKDAIAVYVHKTNPIESLSFRQLDEIFSTTMKRGGSSARTWGAVGASGSWAAREIELFGPNRGQGVHSVFRDAVLQGGEFRFEMRGEPVSSSIVQAVGASPNAIGFASYFYASARTRSVLISSGEGEAVAPTQEHVLSGRYPLSRRLYVYVNKRADTPLPTATLEFLRYVCSRAGQQVAARDGNYPLDAKLVREECAAALQ